MRVVSASRRAIVLMGAFAGVLSEGLAQVPITSGDLFNQPGQYYRAYANDSTTTVTVSGVLGSPGGPQAWDFSTGPQTVTYRFDYVPPTRGLGGADFVAVGATVAEQKTNEANTNDVSWLYFTQDPVGGRLDYGFYDPTFSASQPESVFTNALQDFPNTMHYGDTWEGTTVFYSTYSYPGYGDFPEQITYTATAKVDAYGIVTLPKIGFLDCLRVHEMARYDVSVDLGLGEGYQALGTQYALNYYWLAPGHGTVVQITSTSPSDGSQPADSLPGGAAAFVRMFELSHTNAAPPPASIQGFKLTLSPTAALLQWTALPSVTSYRVDYTTNPSASTNWQILGSTAANYLIDQTARASNAPVRFYRVVGLVN